MPDMPDRLSTPRVTPLTIDELEPGIRGMQAERFDRRAVPKTNMRPLDVNRRWDFLQQLPNISPT